MKTIEEKLEELKVIPGLYEFIIQNAFVAGGAVRDIIRNKKPKDYDIFFKNQKAIDEFKNKFAYLCVESVLGNYNYNDFQFITLKYGSPSEVISKFDWNVNQVYYDPYSKLPKHYSMYLQNNNLSFNCDADHPLSALLRLPYLIEKGFGIEPREFAFVVAFISNLGVLSSSEKANKQMAFVPSSYSNCNLTNIPERAKDAALKKSPLFLALKED